MEEVQGNNLTKTQRRFFVATHVFSTLLSALLCIPVWFVARAFNEFSQGIAALYAAFWCALMVVEVAMLLCGASAETPTVPKRALGLAGFRIVVWALLMSFYTWVPIAMIWPYWFWLGLLVVFQVLILIYDMWFYYRLDWK